MVSKLIRIPWGFLIVLLVLIAFNGANAETTSPFSLLPTNTEPPLSKPETPAQQDATIPPSQSQTPPLASNTQQYYLVDQVRNLADLPRLRAMGINTVIQQMSVDARPASWRSFMQAAKDAGINVVIYPAKAQLRENCSMPYPAGYPDGNIDLLKPMMNVLAEYKNWIGMINAHEPYWSCKMTEQEMAGLKRQIKEYTTQLGRSDIKVWNYIDNIDGHESLEDKEIDQIADVFITWQHCAGGAEGSCEKALNYLRQDRARLNKAQAKAELVWIVQTFTITGSKYARKFTLQELQTVSCQAINVGLEGFGFYTWDAWYSENLVDWPDLHPAIPYISQNCWQQSSEPPPVEPYAEVQIQTPEIQIGKTTQAGVQLVNVPQEGLSGAEFTCTYQAEVISISNLAASNLFGNDPVVAINNPTAGAFIIAIVGSQGYKATSNGVAFTFDIQGLREGQTTIACAARVARNEQELTELASRSAILTVASNLPTPSPTAEVATHGILLGQVVSSKPALITLKSEDSSLVLTQTTQANGTFQFPEVFPGNYLLFAQAEGSLQATGRISIAAGQSLSLTAVTLLFGDIDANNVIDQFDAMTIGMNYNGTLPAAADLNADGAINFFDLQPIARNYRQIGPIPWP
ncbi:MAG: hypothetical protein DDG60_11695 [Anaerolineae bacterium]|nr:MAG: hypothetical protein DDG60_11695 [Anaerolineae bacterium]